MDKVYIVLKGERYRGGYIVSAHQSLKSAKVAVLKLSENNGGSFHNWLRTENNLWQKGAEFIQIVKSEILK